MNKFEIRNTLINNENAKITFDFINDTVVLLVVNENKIIVNEIIDTFNIADFNQKRKYWFSFLEKCGIKNSKDITLNSYEYEKTMAQIVLEQFKQESE
ncbi:hypothetical protein [Bacillus mycoides]|uniref:hypothetical protein n=1 Tax=Bacillus mycoides TaxID=1405 RepID=UPI003D659A70